MTDWQTSLMQQVVDPSLLIPTDRFVARGLEAQVLFQRSPAARDRPAPPASADMVPRISVKHVGHALQGSAEHPELRDFLSLLLRRDPARKIEDHLDSLLARGFPAEHVYLRVLQPAARFLGEMWLEDTCTFVDVTLAVAALQSGMRHLAPRFHQHARAARGMRSVILGPLNGDQHTFGLTMAGEFFRRSGWTVAVTSGSCDEVADRLRGERNAVVGFSASRADQLPELASAIRRLRRHGRDRLAGILVGGPLFVTRPECARDVGADAVGLDARQALAEAEALASARDGG